MGTNRYEKQNSLRIGSFKIKLIQKLTSLGF